MGYRLFIDDERDPVSDDWVIARNHDEVRQIISIRGMPSFVSFDHDLGSFINGDGYKIAKYLVDLDMNTKFKFPDDFGYYVHSQNPIGKKNIEGYLNNYLSLRNET